jgi:hypothetical protein
MKLSLTTLMSAGWSAVALVSLSTGTEAVAQTADDPCQGADEVRVESSDDTGLVDIVSMWHRAEAQPRRV